GDRGKNEFTKVPVAMLKKVSISIPVDKEGNYDIDAQKSQLNKYKTIEALEAYIAAEIASLKDIAIDIPLNQRSLSLKVEVIFDLEQQTNTSFFTKQFVNQYKGDIPVYSASKDELFPGYGYIQDNLPGVKYFNDILTWNIDGSVGKAFFRKGRFSLSEKVIPLILKKEWEGVIDYEFAKYVLEERAVESGFGFSRKAGKVRIKDLEIAFPVMEQNGKILPDLHEQKRLAEKYRQMYRLKVEFVAELQGLLGLNILVA